jgi:radical SAM protein with 4Fe4S-binding SPASM domain
MFDNNEKSVELANRIGLEDINEAMRFPKFFEIETVNACNARCIMCTINEWTGNDSVKMSDELFDKFVQEVSQYSDWIEIICLNRDGEPTLDKSIDKKIKALKDVGIKKVRFVTNAQKLDENLARRVLEAGIDEVMFSIDSTEKEAYEAIRVNLSYDVVVQNTLNYIKLRDEINSNSKVTIRMIEMPETIHQKEKWLEYWIDKVSSTDSVYTMPMHTWGSQFGDVANEKVDRYASVACISPFSSMAIHSDGKIGICAADYNSKNIMGSFENESIEQIWQSEKFMEVREAHLNNNRNKYEICQGCDIWNRVYTNG